MRVYHVPSSTSWNRALGITDVLLAYDGSPSATIDRAFGFLAEQGGHVLLDSGAFGAWKDGRPRDLTKYISVCKALSSVVDAYASLDVIGDWRGSESNYLVMRAAGLEPIPTFHTGEPVAALERMLDSFTGYVGLGGLVGLHKNQRRAWLDDIWSRLVRHPRWPFRVHGWGMTDTSLMVRYPWASVDSTSVVLAIRGGGTWKPPKLGRSITDQTKPGAHGIVRARAYLSDVSLAAELAAAKWKGVVR